MIDTTNKSDKNKLIFKNKDFEKLIKYHNVEALENNFQNFIILINK